jgi:hypothetical protein
VLLQDVNYFNNSYAISAAVTYMYGFRICYSWIQLQYILRPFATVEQQHQLVHAGAFLRVRQARRHEHVVYDLEVSWQPYGLERRLYVLLQWSVVRRRRIQQERPSVVNHSPPS